MFERQRAHAPQMGRTTVAERRDRLRRLKAAILERRPAFHAALAADLRKPVFESEFTEIHVTLAEIDHAIRHLGRWMRPQRVGTPWLLFGTRSTVQYEPRGVVLIVAPWNYPFSLLLNPLVAAVAAGNCAVVKPSEKAPETARLLVELVQAVFDPTEVAALAGGLETAQALLDLPFDHIFFTGSTAVGKLVMAAAANHLASVTLELGGKSPAVVDASADPVAAARRIAWGKFVNAGQTCIAPDYVLVHASRERVFVDALTACIAAMYGATEDDRARSPDLARIVDDDHVRRLTALLDATVAEGAKIECGGRVEAATRYIAPTVLTRVMPSAAIMQDEIFGPILPVLMYRELDEAIAVIRGGGKPLAMYLFSRDEAVTRTLLQQTSAGATTINNTLVHYGNLALPFGGVGASGMGSYHGVHGFRAFSHARAVVRQHEPALARFFFPPYRGRMHAIARRVLKFLEIA